MRLRTGVIANKKPCQFFKPDKAHQHILADADTPTTLMGLFDISNDKSLIERCKKAFLHSTQLCGGKKENFFKIFI